MVRGTLKTNVQGRAKLLTFLADYHTHTYHSHGKGSVEDNVKAALNKGLEAIAITDHGPANLFGVGVKNLKTFELIRQELEACQVKYPAIRILLGVEANIISLGGTLDIPIDQLHEFDIILAGLHLLVYPDNLATALLFSGNLVGRFWARLKNALREINTQAVIASLNRYPIDILTHPGLHVNIDTEAVGSACCQTHTYMEINTSHDHITPEYLKIAYDAGARFVIGSDAHSPHRVGDLISGVEFAKTAGVPLTAIHNLKIGQETWT
ncbi:MAG: PHP domain-containing protein [Firmicutes bacterium]|nr:PHP domain-containing protein [Bacillota bacterium]